MLKYFALKNFRCFSSLRLDSLARVNLIAGKNNVGKTALLEALQIFSSPQDCSLPFSLHCHRVLIAVRKRAIFAV
jgi:AAA15 family ATPase/GTPase